MGEEGASFVQGRVEPAATHPPPPPVEWRRAALQACTPGLAIKRGARPQLTAPPLLKAG